MDPSSTVSALKSSQYCNNFLNLSGEYFCLSEVFPGPHSPPPPPPQRIEVTPYFSELLIMLDPCPQENEGPSRPLPRSQSPKTQDCGHLATQMGHQEEVAALQMAPTPSVWEPKMCECFLYSCSGWHGREGQSSQRDVPMSATWRHRGSLQRQFTKSWPWRSYLSFSINCFIFPYVAVCTCFSLPDRL